MVGYPLHGVPTHSSYQFSDQPGMGNMFGAGSDFPLGDLLETAMEFLEVIRLLLRDD